MRGVASGLPGGVSSQALITNPFDWANPAGAAQFYGVMLLILLGTGLKPAAGRWIDWLDERSGRGSIRDTWLLREIEQDAPVRPHRDA